MPKKNPFLTDEIPQEIETQILSQYTDLCHAHDEQDLTSKYLFSLISKLHISKRLLIDLQIKDYCISGTQILDIDKLVVQLGKMVIMSNNIDVILHNWILLLKLIPEINIDEIFEYKLTKSDVLHISKELGVTINHIDDMFNILNTKPYINFYQFSLLIGKLGL